MAEEIQMSVDTEDLIEKDEDLKATESRIIELRQKKDRTADEEKEFKDLKSHHRGRIEEQIQSERDRAAQQQERAAKAEQALEDARARLKEIEDRRDSGREVASGSENETYVVNGKKFFTDEAISIRVQKGLMTQSEGWKMQREAIKEEAKAELQGDEPKKNAQKIRNESLEYVRKKGYGWMLDEKDPKFKANDPLYKLANKLWTNGYQYDADGPRKALDDAMELMGKNDPREDLSDDLGVPKNNASSSSQREKKIELTEIEQANALRYWPTVENPKTGRKYTEQESLAKALEAKRRRFTK
jgi:hypothetical protein